MNKLIKHPGGRPTLYNSEVLSAAKFYLQYYEDMGKPLPSIEGLARYLKIGLSTIKGWANDIGKEEFLATLEDIKTEQAEVLINKGINSEINATIGKLMLANHGYHERSEVATFGMNGKASDDAITITFPSHEAIQLERIEEERAKLEKDKEEFNRSRLSFIELEKDNNNDNDNEQQ